MTHGCAYQAMTYDPSGALCDPRAGGCGMRWNRDDRGYESVTFQGRTIARRGGWQ